MTERPPAAGTSRRARRRPGRPGAVARPRRRGLLVVPVLAVAITATASLTSPTPSQAADVTKTFVPTADAYVRSDQPSTNFGAKFVLGAEAGSATTPTVTSYLTFAVSGLTGTVTSATLQLYSYATSTQGVIVSTAPTGWSESTLTYDTAPAVGQQIGSSGLTLNVWASVDVLPAVSGNGTVSLALTTTRTTNNQLASREATATPPKLVITTSPDPSPTTTSPSSSPSPTPTTSAPGTSVSIVAAGDIACTAGKAVTATSC